MGNPSETLTLGRYAIHGEIASGGMATVYLGRLEGPVGFSRAVAIKRMHPHIARDPDFATMFLDEATLAARIQHPNVVATLDIVAQGGEVFIVMEYIKGDSLAHLVRDKRRRRIQLELPTVLSVMIGLLTGLHAAHEAEGEDGAALNIVHRDVSPQNVLVGEDGLARIVDFGVAKAAVRAGVTRDNQIKGKMSYMSPEQVSGRGTVDRRADVFAAGAILFEALAGQRLFSADDTGGLVARVMNAEVPPLSQFRNDVPPAVEQVMRKALLADMDQRFATAQDFADALEDAADKIATQRAVGRWVKTRAAAVIAERDEIVSRIESSIASAPQLPEPFADPLTEVSTDLQSEPSADLQSGQSDVTSGVRGSMPQPTGPSVLTPYPESTLPESTGPAMISNPALLSHRAEMDSVLAALPTQSNYGKVVVAVGAMGLVFAAVAALFVLGGSGSSEQDSSMETAAALPAAESDETEADEAAAETTGETSVETTAQPAEDQIGVSRSAIDEAAVVQPSAVPVEASAKPRDEKAKPKPKTKTKRRGGDYLPDMP